MEIEAKFIIEPIVFRQILKLKDIAGYKVKRIVDITENDTYIDTKNLDLHRQNISYRIRKKGNTYLVTLKEKPVKTGSIYSRFEEETYIKEKEVPKLYKYNLNIKPVIKVKELTEGKKLYKIFTINKKRKRAEITKGKHLIRIDMDTIQFLIDGAKEKEYELEVESKNTPMEEVEEVEGFLRKKFGKKLKPSKHTKYERGVRLLSEI